MLCVSISFIEARKIDLLSINALQVMVPKAERQRLFQNLMSLIYAFAMPLGFTLHCCKTIIRKGQVFE